MQLPSAGNTLYHDFLDHLNFAGNPAESAEELENPVQFDGLFFESSVFYDLVREFIADLYPSCAPNPEIRKEFDGILKNHLISQ